MIDAARKSAASRALKGPLLAGLRTCNSLVRRVGAATHAAQHYLEWGVPPLPEWYDHYLDVHWAWPRRGSALFLERGVLGSLVIAPGATVLELCCGDGFNAKNFYALRAERVLAVDFDGDAIKFARRRNGHPRIEYRLADIRTEMPEGRFSNVMLDAAIEHFTEAEIDRILEMINGRLIDEGVLSGYTVVEREPGKKHLVHHEREFTGQSDLMQFLAKRFPHAWVFETVHPERTNLYFYASRSAAALPFAGENKSFLRHG